MCVGEQTVQDPISCIMEFDCLPFGLTSPTLRTLQPPIPTPRGLIHDFYTTRQDVELRLTAFMAKRVPVTLYSYSPLCTDNIYLFTQHYNHFIPNHAQNSNIIEYGRDNLLFQRVPPLEGNHLGNLSSFFPQF